MSRGRRHVFETTEKKRRAGRGSGFPGSAPALLTGSRCRQAPVREWASPVTSSGYPWQRTARDQSLGHWVLSRNQAMTRSPAAKRPMPIHPSPIAATSTASVSPRAISKEQHDGTKHGIEEKAQPDRGQNQDKKQGSGPGPAGESLLARARSGSLIANRRRVCDRPEPVRTPGRARDRAGRVRISDPLPDALSWSAGSARKHRRISDGFTLRNLSINPSGTSADPRPRAGSRQRFPSCPSLHRADWAR